MNTKKGFHYQLSLYAGQKYCIMLQEEHSAILSTFIQLLFPIKTFIFSVFKWPLKTGFTVVSNILCCRVDSEYTGMSSHFFKQIYIYTNHAFKGPIYVLRSYSIEMLIATRISPYSSF